jgi:hypothetical protein
MLQVAVQPLDKGESLVCEDSRVARHNVMRSTAVAGSSAREAAPAVRSSSQ